MSFIGCSVEYQPIRNLKTSWPAKRLSGSLPSTRCHAGLSENVSLIQFPKLADGSVAVDLYLRLPPLHCPFLAGPQQNRGDGYILEVCKNRRTKEPLGGSVLCSHGNQHSLLVLRTRQPFHSVQTSD